MTTDIEWVPTGDPNVIAASGYPVQIERLPDRGRFVVSGYGRSNTTETLGFAQWTARSWITEQIEFNSLAGVDDC